MAGITIQCPSWEYKDVLNHSDLLLARSKSILLLIRAANNADRLRHTKNTQPLHGRYFEGLAPAGCEYYAGNYRGSNFVCLKDYIVKIQNDPLVGFPPDRVIQAMSTLSTDIQSCCDDCDVTWPANEQVISKAEKLYRIVQVAVALFVFFLQIHPYANGNGHMARFVLISFLSRYDIFLSRWSVDPRPADPPYSEFIKNYRRGDRAPLERFVLSCI